MLTTTLAIQVRVGADVSWHPEIEIHFFATMEELARDPH